MTGPILLTGFEPFGGEAINPSAEIVGRLQGQRIAGASVVAAVLPCAFGTALQRLHELLALHQPRLVLAIGQAGGRADLCVERVAINLDDARIPDNAGAQPVDVPIVPGGPAARFSTLPIKAMVAALQAAGLPASVSNTAGTFVCNHVFYGLQQALANSGVPSGFLHVPLLPEQAARWPTAAPSVPLQAMVDGIAVALAAALTTPRDLRLSGGREH